MMRLTLGATMLAACFCSQTNALAAAPETAAETARPQADFPELYQYPFRKMHSRSASTAAAHGASIVAYRTPQATAPRGADYSLDLPSKLRPLEPAGQCTPVWHLVQPPERTVPYEVYEIEPPPQDSGRWIFGGEIRLGVYCGDSIRRHRGVGASLFCFRIW